MGMSEYQKAKDLISHNTGKSHFVGSRSALLVQKAEQTLGIRFPPTYRAFLLDFGAGNFGAFEVYGIIDDDFENSSVPDAIWFTLTERREVNFPADILVIGDAGTGELYCLRVSQSDNEGTVVLIDPGMINEELAGQPISKDFGCYILENIQRQMAR